MTSCQHSKGFKIPITIKSKPEPKSSEEDVPKIEPDSVPKTEYEPKTEPAAQPNQEDSSKLSSSSAATSLESQEPSLIDASPSLSVTPQNVVTPVSASVNPMPIVSSQPTEPLQPDTAQSSENPACTVNADQPPPLRGLGSRTSEETKNADKKALR